MNFDDYEEATKLYKEFRSRREVSQDLEENEAEEANAQEEEDTLRRVQEFIVATSKEVDTDPAYFDEFQYNKKYNPRSSDEEVEELFWQDFMENCYNIKKFGFGQNKENLSEPKPQWAENSDYKYPKIVWNQTKDNVVLSLNLNNVKHCELNFNKNFLSFR